MPGSGWTYRQEDHLGDLAFSLFDPKGERAAVGMILADAQAICRAMNAAPAMAEAHERIANGDWMGVMRFAEDSDGDFLLRVIAEMRKASRTALSQARGEPGDKP